MRKRSANILSRHPSCHGSANTAAGKVSCFQTVVSLFAVAILLLSAALPSYAQSASRRAKKPAAKSASTASKKPATAPARRKSSQAAATSVTRTRSDQLARLSRALRENETPAGTAAAYAALSAFAKRNARNELGARSALALGYYDLMRDKPDLALAWLRKAVDDHLLRDYVLYWQSQASIALGQKEEALEQLQSLRRDFPDSVMAEQTVTSLAQTALDIGKAEDALAALDGYPRTKARPALLLLRAQALEAISAAKGEKPVAAAANYLDLYYRFPLNDEAKTAGQKIPSLQFALGEAFPGTPVHTQIARAETLYLARRWSDARTEFTSLLPKLSGVDHQRAELRIAQCGIRLGGNIELLSALSLRDPDLEAERLYAISQVYRSQKLEPEMLDEIDQLTKRFPQSHWTEQGLFSAGNYYWVNLDRSRAAEFYRRTLDAFPRGKYAQSAAWRVAWTAYLARKAEAADLLENYVRRFPESSYVPDALYWLGRSYERAGNPAHARGFYLAAARRFPLTYFGAKSAERVRPAPRGIGARPLDRPKLLSLIPSVRALPRMDHALNARAVERRARARALSEIAFDASAELEYRAAYAASRSPRLLIDAAGAAISAGHYAAGMVAVRRIFPELEARRIPQIPNDAWRAAFPLPYESSLRGEARRNRLDPMLVAGLIRQESAFESDAMSRAGAVGLMQMMPQTALRLARQMKVRYARARLTDPGYNLRLGSHYLANLIQAFGTPEAALAAYNAGEDRVMQWTAGQNYLEAAEFVESIPFTETREYVQIVIRNAEIYRQVYGPAGIESARLANWAEAVPAGAEETRPARAEGNR